MAKVGIVYGPLKYFTATWQIFGTLVYLPQFGTKKNLETCSLHICDKFLCKGSLYLWWWVIEYIF
jgi:hypothetical protein